MYRYCTGKLLDFRNYDDIAIGCSYLRGVLDNTDNRGTITSANYAIEFLHQFYQDPTTPFPACHELHGSLLVPLTSFPCALFYEQTATREARMPDSSADWLKLTSASCIADPSHEHLSLQQAYYLASDSNFCILSGHHYWVFPQLPHEADQLHSALLDLATAIWDTVNGTIQSTIIRPSQSGRTATALLSSSVQPAVRERKVRVTRYRNGQPIPNPSTPPLPVEIGTPHESILEIGTAPEQESCHPVDLPPIQSPVEPEDIRAQGPAEGKTNDPSMDDATGFFD
jgi:hypothetical protein